MKKTALLLHWWSGNSEENWLPWLNKELENKVFETLVPDLPNTDKPNIEEQLDFINSLSELNSENRKLKHSVNLIVGHSLWCQLAMKYVEENNISNSRIILVAPTYPNLAEELWTEILWDSFDIIKKYYDINLDFEKTNKLNNEIIIFLSDNDPYINMKNAKKYYNNFENIQFLEFKNKWHFNKNAWVMELEDILDFVE